MNKLYLYNTLSRKKEEFVPLKDNPPLIPPLEGGQIGVYSCGPTVYNYAHIGNLRAYIFADILVRTLKYNYGEGQVKWVMNITDVDDKTIRDSKKDFPELELKDALKKFTDGYEKYFWEDMKKINISDPNVVPHAADDKYIDAMKELVKKIFEEGYAYIIDGSAYFNTTEYGNKHKYGQLVNLDLSSLRTGARIDLDEYEKDNVQDFVLWKGKKEGEPFWEFEIPLNPPFGKGEIIKLPGRPGWHIECSAMGQVELGMPFDIHTGGEDLKFPHHEDEIAQSTVGYGVEKPINFWLHNGMLMVEGKKMSKSLGNFYNLRDIEAKGFSPLMFRFLTLQTHYRKPMDFSWEALAAAKNGLEHLYNQVREFKELKVESRNPKSPVGTSGPLRESKAESIDLNFRNKFLEAINDDLNMPKALAVVQELLKSDLSKGEKLSTVFDFDKVLGLSLREIAVEMSHGASLPEDVQQLIDDRQKAREEKNWAESDKLRGEIEAKGYEIEDAKEGMRVIKK